MLKLVCVRGLKVTAPFGQEQQVGRQEVQHRGSDLGDSTGVTARQFHTGSTSRSALHQQGTSTQNQGGAGGQPQPRAPSGLWHPGHTMAASEVRCRDLGQQRGGLPQPAHTLGPEPLAQLA